MPFGDHNWQPKGSLLWPTQSRAELIGASARSPPRTFALTVAKRLRAFQHQRAG
jgi:hypothetical protein